MVSAVDVALVSGYKDRIEELESSLAAYRDHVERLNSSLVELKQERDHFSVLFESNPSAYVVHDGAGFISSMNVAAETLLGIIPRQKVRIALTQFIKGENLVIWLKQLRQSAATRQRTSFTLRLQKAHGQELDVEVVTVPSPGSFRHGPLRFFTLLLDLRPRRETEAALKHALRDYDRLINMVEGIVWEADSNHNFTFVSSYAERLLGFPVAEWTRPDFWRNRIFVEDRERVLSELDLAMNERRELQIDYRVVAADRRLVWLHDSVNVIERRGERKMLGLAIDITDRRQAEEQLREAHFNLEQRVADRTTELRYTVADLEAFSYSLSHDMRAPIRAMQGYAVLLKGILADNPGPQVLDFLERIMQGAERLDLLVQDVLKYSRLARAPIELKPVPLEPLLNNILSDYPVLAPSKARVEIQQPLPVVYGHEAFVGQALSNLLTNAVKFVPKGKPPKVRLWTEEAHPESGGNGSWVRIWVEDNGLGITPEDQKRIFRMFERVYPKEQYEGTGMGLAIVQKAVERMGGHVGVQSEPGAGSKFWIELRQA
jgi:PAS domain S-box-containing protein